MAEKCAYEEEYVTLRTGQTVQVKVMAVRLTIVLTVQPFNRTTLTPNSFYLMSEFYLITFLLMGVLWPHIRTI